MKKQIRMKYQGQEFSVTAERSGDSIVIERDGKSYSVQIVPEQPEAPGSAAAPAPAPAAVPPAGGGDSGAKADGGGAAAAGAITAPMTGTIKEILVSVGDAVSEGETVMMMEAMKMEMEISAHTSGTVKQIMCSSGDSVKENQALLSIE